MVAFFILSLVKYVDINVKNDALLRCFCCRATGEGLPGFFRAVWEADHLHFYIILKHNTLSQRKNKGLINRDTKFIKI